MIKFINESIESINEQLEQSSMIEVAETPEDVSEQQSDETPENVNEASEVVSKIISTPPEEDIETPVETLAVIEEVIEEVVETRSEETTPENVSSNVINDNTTKDNTIINEWHKNVDELVSSMDSRIFVIGKDQDGNSSLPNISSSPEDNFHLMSWNYVKSCGIIYIADDKTFWYSFLDEFEKTDGYQIVDNKMLSKLQRYVK